MKLSRLVFGGIVGVAFVLVVFALMVEFSGRNTFSTVVEESIEYAEATFSGGCFWCSESDFEKTDGVVDVISGFSGGEEVNPTYKEVSAGLTGHREAVYVYYDPAIVSYDQLLDVFLRHIDPTDDGGSFGDRGFVYTSAIYPHDETQQVTAEASKLILEESGRLDAPIATVIESFDSFYPAEDYHQDYYEKNAIRYGYYRNASGRDDYIEIVWGGELEKAQYHLSYGDDEVKVYDPKSYVLYSEDELQAILTPLQYAVTQEDATEEAFNNEYWDNKEAGIYVDIVSGEPLFSSIHKYVSGTGWPSFTEPLVLENIVEAQDYFLIFPRTEIRSALADSHVGHVFDDGPEESGGLRYCMNSAAMRFVPVDELEAAGYGDFVELFEA